MESNNPKLVHAARQRKPYVAPRVEVTIVEMESGIAAASATISPGNSSSSLDAEWETGTDRSTDVNW